MRFSKWGAKPKYQLKRRRNEYLSLKNHPRLRVTRASIKEAEKKRKSENYSQEKKKNKVIA